MLNQQHGHLKLFANQRNGFHQFCGFGRVHACRRFIQKQQRGVGSQCAGNLQLALFAIRQIFCGGIGKRFHAKYRKQCHGFFACGLFFFPVFRGTQQCGCHAVSTAPIIRHQHIIQHRHLFKQTDILKGTRCADANNLLRLFAGYVLPVQRDTAGSGLINAGEQVENSGFACAIWSNEADKFAFGDFNRKVFYCLEAAKNDRDVFCC